MDCQAFRILMGPFLDGELVGEDLLAFEAHVVACATCRAALTEQRRVLKAIRDALPLYQAPSRLREVVTAQLGAGSSHQTSNRRLAAGLVAAALVVVAVWLAGTRARVPVTIRTTSELASMAAHTHLRYTQGHLPLDLSSERPEEISRWFSGRVPFQLALPDYPVNPGEHKLYRLAGARLVAFKNDAAAFVAYRMGDRPISLLVTSAEFVQPAGAEVVASGSLRFHLEAVAGLKVITWTDNGLTYALASDLDVEGSRSCLVCHGSPAERRKLEPLAQLPRSD